MKKLLLIALLLVAVSATTWELSTEKDIMTDVVTNHARLSAINYRDTFSHAPALVIRTVGDEIALYIAWGIGLVARDVSEILVRFGSSDPIAWPVEPVRPSGIWQSSVYIQDADSFLKKMRFKRLIVQCESTLSSPLTGVWDVGDPVQVIRDMNDQPEREPEDYSHLRQFEFTDDPIDLDNF